MKKICTLFLLLMFFFTTGCNFDKRSKLNDIQRIKEQGYITVGVKTDSKPFGFINKKTGKNDGFDIDIAKYIAKNILGSEDGVKYVQVTPSSKIEAILSGEVDMVIATMSITPQRQFLVDFSIPYYIAGQTAVVRDASDIHNFSDLRNKVTIIVLGSTAEENIRKILPTAKLYGFKTYTEAFNAFQNGQGDAISTDNTILSGFMMENKGYRMLKIKISQEPYAVAFKKNEKDDSLKKTINMVLRQLEKDGTLKKLKKKWKC